MRLDRGFSTVVVLTLAIGIGACTAVFSIINALLWGSLPYPNPEQLAIVWESDRDNRAQTFIVAHPNYEDWKREAKSFSSMGIWEYQTFNVASDAEPEQVQGIRATSSLFTVLGVPPAMGRIFTEAEEAPGHRLVVISDGVWRTHLGGRASAIGSSLRLNGEAYEVIGDHAEGIPVPVAQQRRVGAVCADGAGSPARFAFVLGRGAHQAGGDVRIGARGDRADRPRAPAALRGERRRGRNDHTDGGPGPRHPENHAHGVDGRGLAGPPDRLRQRGQPAARARAVAAAGICDAPLARRRHRPSRAAVVRGVAGARRGRRASARLALAWIAVASRGPRAHAGVPRLTVPRRGADRD